jgi:hypothetical protein
MCDFYEKLYLDKNNNNELNEYLQNTKFENILSYDGKIY